jgi:hypothetical protein
MDGGCPRQFMAGALAFALALAAPAVRAQALHKCLSADGSIAYQDRPCPTDSSELPRPPAAEMRGLAPQAGAYPVPAPATAPGVPDPPASSDAPAPLPALYRCETGDGKRYVSSTATPRGRYVPLWALSDWPSIEGPVGATPPGSRGVGGTTAPPGGPRPGARAGWPATMAAGYTWVQDRCYAMGRGEACAHWRAEIDRVGAARRIAFEAERATLDGEYRELRALFARHCH